MTELERTIADETFWRRANAPLVDVSYPRRTIELVVMPYDEAAVVPFDGRLVKETIARGAFDGIERRANRVRVNRDHRPDRLVGKAITFHPRRPEGFVAEVRIANTELGNETLELADDGCLDASAGFMPLGDNALEWHGRDAYTVRRAFLGHIALTPDPAYDGAKVLAVRAAVEVAPVAPNTLEWRQAIVDGRAAIAASLRV
jgi:HK97 family phage prohead protease